MDKQVPVGFPAALAASFFFGWAIVSSRGAYSEPALTFVLLGTIVVGWRYAAGLRPTSEQVPVRVVAPLAWGVALSMAFYAYNDAEIIIYPVKMWELGRRAQGWLLFALLSYLPSFFPKVPDPGWLRHVRFACIALCIAAAGHDVILTSPTPHIDVWTVQQQGAHALWNGLNPFLAVHVGDTGPRTANDVPYVYPPLQLYLTALVWRLTHEVRYAMLGAILLLGLMLRVLLRRTRRDLPAVLEDAPALFVWCTPKLFFILEQSWVDPVQVFWCTAMLTAASFRRPWLTAVMAGMVLAAKQTMLLFVGLFGLGLRFTWKQWAVTGAVALATFAPWMLWDFKALKHANFDFLAALPVRPDALTYLTWVKRKFGVQISPIFAFPAAFLITALAAWKMRRSEARLAMAAVAAFTVFFVINKWAFANYYFTLLGLSALAAAVSSAPETETAPAAPR
jgi:hypothetical protein